MVHSFSFIRRDLCVQRQAYHVIFLRLKSTCCAPIVRANNSIIGVGAMSGLRLESSPGVSADHSERSPDCCRCYTIHWSDCVIRARKFLWVLSPRRHAHPGRLASSASTTEINLAIVTGPKSKTSPADAKSSGNGFEPPSDMALLYRSIARAGSSR